MHLALLYSEATLWTYFSLTNAASIPKKHFCVSQYTNTCKVWIIDGAPWTLCLLAIKYCVECRQFFFFHGLPPIQPFYTPTQNFQLWPFHRDFLWQSSSHPVEPQVSRSGFRDTFLGIIALPKKDRNTLMSNQYSILTRQIVYRADGLEFTSCER